MIAPPPQISVLMAVHNGEDYLQAAIDSVLGQEFRDFEFVIVDDDSEDRSQTILEQSAARDQRIRIFRNPENLGLTRSLNLGLEQCKAEFIARMDADDICNPNRLAVQIQAMRDNADLMIIGSGCELIDENGATRGCVADDLGPMQAKWFLSLAPVCYHPTYFFRRISPDGSAVLYDPSFATAQDYDLWSRMAENGATRVLPDALLRYRRHPKGISSTKRLDQASDAKRISLRNLALRLDPDEVEKIAPLVNCLAFEGGVDPHDIRAVVAAAERLIETDAHLFTLKGERKWFRRTVAAFTADAVLSRSKAIRTPVGLLAFAWYARHLLPSLIAATLSNPSRARKSLSSAFKRP